MDSLISAAISSAVNAMHLYFYSFCTVFDAKTNPLQLDFAETGGLA